MKTNKFNRKSIEVRLTATKAIDAIAFGFAVLGCIFLILVVFISFFSILGRMLFDKPILGDFELVEMGCAVAIFMFLPLCQLRNGNIIVDAFTLKLDLFKKAILDLCGTTLFCVVAIFFSVRMIYGLLDMLQYKEQTMLLQIPVWIPFVPAILSFLLLSLTCIFSIFEKVTDLFYRGSDEWIE